MHSNNKQTNSAKVDKAEVSITESSRKEGNVFYKLTLNKPVGAGESVTIKMRCSLGEALRALPATSMYFF